MAMAWVKALVTEQFSSLEWDWLIEWASYLPVLYLWVQGTWCSKSQAPPLALLFPVRTSVSVDPQEVNTLSLLNLGSPELYGWHALNSRPWQLTSCVARRKSILHKQVQESVQCWLSGGSLPKPFSGSTVQIFKLPPSRDTRDSASSYHSFNAFQNLYLLLLSPFPFFDFVDLCIFFYSTPCLLTGERKAYMFL